MKARKVSFFKDWNVLFKLVSSKVMGVKISQGSIFGGILKSGHAILSRLLTSPKQAEYKNGWLPFWFNRKVPFVCFLQIFFHTLPAPSYAQICFIYINIKATWLLLPAVNLQLHMILYNFGHHIT